MQERRIQFCSRPPTRVHRALTTDPVNWILQFLTSRRSLPLGRDKGKVSESWRRKATRLQRIPATPVEPPNVFVQGLSDDTAANDFGARNALRGYRLR